MEDPAHRHFDICGVYSIMDQRFTLLVKLSSSTREPIAQVSRGISQPAIAFWLTCHPNTLPIRHVRTRARACPIRVPVNGTRRQNRNLLPALETLMPRRCLGGGRSDGEGVAGGELREVVIEIRNGFGVEPRYPA
ncbi:hypothetical protein SNOG_16314 [Parastagonospora nodorum SN15]|uniref:Uncharacterized protein n=1 Tax=Phaeosphaeria nodorum (strain SN15 / ATCC MYA-4574 / FGSC 10173) TaxID=321614 RepID=Q0TW00_PHANO|nr:hypothetical protein SNOG_16314 [Parastagonospora nodorum SN15]EAT76300.1 hypothetical protein SNOG_16314 [Parastagonospora nodorum SN15]